MKKRCGTVLLFMFLLSVGLVSASHFSLSQQEAAILGWNQQLSDYAKLASTRALTSQEVRDAAAIAKLRKLEMTEVLARDSLLFSGFLLREDIVQDLPKEVQEYLEKRVAEEGVFRVRHLDAFDGSVSFPLYYLVVGEDAFRLFGLQDVSSIAVESQIRVSGVLLGNALLAENFFFISAGGRGGGSQFFGEMKVAVVLIGFKDAPFAFPFHQFGVSFTQEDFDKVFSEVQAFYRENSYEKFIPSFVFYGPYILESSADYSSCEEIYGAIRIQPGDIPEPHKIVIPSAGKCNSYVGASPWYAFVSLSDLITRGSFVVSHEFGHTMNYIRHANFWDCTQTTSEGKKKCVSAEYKDTFEVMGEHLMHFNAIHKESLGWLDPTHIKTITISGAYTLLPYEKSFDDSLPDQFQVLKIQKGGLYYYLEYRTSYGYDANSLYHSYNRGPLLRFPGIFQGGDTQLVDLKPFDGAPSPDYVHTALNPGEYYYSTDGRFTLTTLEADASGTKLEVLFDPKFIRADANGDEKVDVSDATFILQWLFQAEKTPGCLDAADVNNDGKIDLSDAVYVLQYLFQGGLVPPYPHSPIYPDETLHLGWDDLNDLLDCACYPASSCSS